MEKIKLIENIKEAMMDYQRENGITGCCISNTQIMYDVLCSQYFKELNINPIVKSVYTIDVEVSKNITSRFMGGHLVIFLGDNLYDCSYDISSKKYILYYNSFRDFKEQVQDNDISVKCLKDDLYFAGIAERMNKGEFFYSNRESYEDQIKYIEERMGFKFVNYNI